MLTASVSILASIYNEEKSLTPLVERTVATMEQYPPAQESWEFLLINDASEDDSGMILEKLVLRFPHVVRVIHHPQRQGQKGCFMSGFQNARGRVSVLMDADLQVLPEELPRLLDPILLDGAQMVCTCHDVARGGPRMGVGRGVSRIGNLFMKLLFRSPVRDAGANFMAVQTRYLQGVRLVANDQRYLLPIAMRRGLERITEVGCAFQRRVYGRSKYRYWKKALEGIPEMLLLKRRLLAGFYDHPPVPEESPVKEVCLG